LNAYEQPNRQKSYYFGIDVGISNDYTVLTILDEAGRCHGISRFNGKSLDATGETIVSELKRWNIRGGYCERNNIGQAVYEYLSRKNIKVKGFQTTQESKTQGVRALIQDIENQVLELPSKDLFPHLYHELSSYTYKVSANGKLSFSHPNGQHDDCVDSLFLANLARTELGFSRGKLYIGNMRK